MAGWFGGVFGDVEDGSNGAVVGTCNSGGQQYEIKRRDRKQQNIQTNFRI